MKHIHVIFGRIRPNIKLNHPHTSMKSFYNRHITAVAAQLISGQVWIVSGVYVIMRQRRIHIMVYLNHTNHRKSHLQVTKNQKLTST